MVNANLNQISIDLSQYLAAITFDIEFFNEIFPIFFFRAQVSCHFYPTMLFSNIVCTNQYKNNWSSPNKF